MEERGTDRRPFRRLPLLPIRITGPLIRSQPLNEAASQPRTQLPIRFLDKTILLHLLQIGIGVHRSATVGVDLKMQMRCTCTRVPGAPDLSDDFARLNPS